MKKGLVIPLATAIIFSLAGSVLAATNPFSTVPAKHWAYDSVQKLVHDGLIDGYGDGDFRGDKPITRYEMAVLTAKAISNLQKADAKDKVVVDQLKKEFSEELTTLGVRVKSLESDVKNLKANSSNINLTGNFRVRYDHHTSVDAYGKSTTTDPKTMARDSSYYFEMTGKSKIDDDWNLFVRVLGAKDANGDNRGGQEGTDGSFDISRMYAYGNLGGGTLKVGRDKNAILNAMVWGDYSTGASYSFGNKLKANITYAKPNHKQGMEENTIDTRGVKDTFLNPTDSNLKATYTTTTTTVQVYDKNGNPVTDKNGHPTYTSTSTTTSTNPDQGTTGGCTFQSLDLTYAASPATNLYGAFYHVKYYDQSRSVTEGTVTVPWSDTNIWELAFDTNVAQNLNFAVDYAKSNRATDNKAYDFNLTYGKADKAIPHSAQLSYDYVSMGSQSYIKTTYDVNDSTNGRRGWFVCYKFVPAKNVTWNTRWLNAIDIDTSYSKGVAVHNRDKWLRTEVTYFF